MIFVAATLSAVTTQMYLVETSFTFTGERTGYVSIYPFLIWFVSRAKPSLLQVLRVLRVERIPLDYYE